MVNYPLLVVRYVIILFSSVSLLLGNTEYASVFALMAIFLSFESNN